MKIIQIPAPILTPEYEFGALLLQPPVSSIISKEGVRRERNTHSFFSAIRAFLRRLVDDSAFRDVSLSREISIIFTANGALIYRWESNNNKPPVRS
jgi:hypothetical protein